MEPTPDYFAKILRQVMRDRGLNKIKDLAELLEVTPSQVSFWLSPRSYKDMPGDKKLSKIAELSGIAMQDLEWCKNSIKRKAKGLEITPQSSGTLPLDRDQERVMELMDQEDYAGAVQYLLEMMRGPSAPIKGGRTKRVSAGR